MWKHKSSGDLHIHIRNSLISLTMLTGPTVISLESNGVGLDLKKRTLQKAHSCGSYFPHEPKFAFYITALLKSVCHPPERIPQSSLQDDVQDVNCYNSVLLLFWNVSCAFTWLHCTYASSACSPRLIYFKAEEVQNSRYKYLCSDRNNMLPLLAGAVRRPLLPVHIPNLGHKSIS